MTSIGLAQAAIAVMGTSGLPAWFFPRRSRLGQVLTTALFLLGSALGLAGLALAFPWGSPQAYDTNWFLPWGRWSVAIDAIGAVFLALVFTIPALGSVYGLGYWRQSENPESGRRLGLAWGVLAASMVLVVMARDAMLFLVAWEIMALSAWLAATAEADKPEVRRAGWVYLLATHAGTLCLFAMFSLWRSGTGSFELATATGLLPEAATAIFALALVGFGFKAGLMPLHVWLPGAHANAPSHVSAVMSGVMLKMGIYGLVRMTALLPAPEASWGWALLVAGAISGIAGIANAIGQRDLKRLLAYSSVENIGIIAMGIGLGLLGRSYGRADLALLGMGGALFHVINHGLFKPLLFLNAGAVIHATGTRRLDRLGGLAASMPLSAALFALGATAIAALPPLNGFVGELLLYLGFFRAVGPGTAASLASAAAAAAALAAIGALAVAAFVKAFGGIYLGTPRSAVTVHGDPPLAMSIPMVLLAAACVTIGFFPGLLLPFVGAAAGIWAGLGEASPRIGDLADLGWLPWTGLALLGLGLPLFLGFSIKARRGSGAASHAGAAASHAGAAASHMGAAFASGADLPTWDCGYAAPSARMQYTPSSFSAFPLQGLAFLLLPRRRRPRVESAFPKASSFSSSLPDLALDRVLGPIARFAGRMVPGIRLIQQGQTQLYLVYVLMITIILLAIGVGSS